jgi:hypothetical protein
MSLLRRGEYHAFKGDGAPFLYLVPSAAVYQLDDASVAVLDEIGERDLAPNDLANSLYDPLSTVGQLVDYIAKAYGVP